MREPLIDEGERGIQCRGAARNSETKKERIVDGRRNAGLPEQ
jgi:hypothetical protein